MTAKNRTDIQSEIDSLLADNVTGDISPSDVRIVHGTSKDSNLNLLESTTQIVAGLTNYTGGLQVAGAKVLPAATTVIANAKSDLPSPSAGVIALAANTNYVQGASFSLGTDRLDVNAGNISWTANNAFNPTLTYTGTNPMFTGVDVSFNIFNARIDCPNATIFDISDVAAPGTNIFQMLTCLINNAAKVGKFTGLGQVLVANTGVIGTTQGVEILGSNAAILSFFKFSMTSSSASFIGIDLGTSVTVGGEINNLNITAPLGAIGVSGAANNANIAVGGLFTFRDSNFNGGMTAEISGITTDDFRWAFNFNSGLPDTNPDALLSLTGNTTETVISASSTDGTNAVLMAGTFVIERTSHYTGTTGGRATYDGERELAVPVTIQATVEAASGTNKDIAMYLALDGVVVASARSKAKVGTSDPRTVSVPWQINFTQTKFVEIFLENQTDTINLIGTDAILRIR